jgi:exodeoxyribonuclease VII small subunit
MTADLSFEEAMARLEEILRRLEQGDVSLDEALGLWREGDALHRRCLELLSAAEGRIEELERAPGDNGPANG